MITAENTQKTAQHLRAAWENQQAAYITRREERFELMLDVLSQCVPEDATVLDLACGPGSICARVLERFPHMNCVGVDFDPVLLALARDALGECEGNRFQVVEADLATSHWQQALPGGVNAVLSSTALHWLSPAEVTRLYGELAAILAPGAIFLNADHLRHSHGRHLFEHLSATDDARTQAATHRDGALTWDQWWQETTQVQAYRELLPLRQRRFADRLPSRDLSPEFHSEALRTAGFAEAGTIWQHFDDYILLARR